MAQSEPCIPLPLEDQEFLQELVEKGKDWVVLHGVGMRSNQHFSRDSITIAPFLLFPSTFPKAEFNKARKIQTVLNELMHKVAHDDAFLRKVLIEVAGVDQFTHRLLQIYQEVLTEGVAQKYSLGLFRSDYMLDSNSGTIKQVEFNTIASSFGVLTTILPKWHSYVLSLMGPEHKEKVANVPSSDTLTGYADAIVHAYNLYNERSGTENSAIMFVVEDKSTNIGDQRLLEFEIQSKVPHARVLRKTLTEIGKQIRLGDRKRLFINDIEVSVVYYRAGYVPAFYHSELEWDARLLMERSMAIKCPSVQYQLAGSKKVQQELARHGVLEQFLSDPEEVKAVRDIFTGLYSLDMSDPEAESMIRKAMENPSAFVLKPQREGGGNNFYGEDIERHLRQIQRSEERHAWILMDKISPPSCKNYIIRPGHEEPIFGDVVGELGIFGVIIGDREKIVLNKEVGHMIRTKGTDANEGGVALGFGALDSVYLAN